MDEGSGKGQHPCVSAQFHDRVDAGRQLAEALEPRRLGDAVVVGLARGGVVVAGEIARRLSLPFDALAVRKIGHPRQPEYGIGAVTPGGDVVYLRSPEGLGDLDLRRAIEKALAEADALDRILHERHEPVDLSGRTAVLVDDGLATGVTMVAAVRWARSRGAARVIVSVPVGAAQSLGFLRSEADEVVCPHEPGDFWAVGFWYDVFTQVKNEDVVVLLDELDTPAAR
jgi:putative phosphoribosyl transferase